MGSTLKLISKYIGSRIDGEVEVRIQSKIKMFFWTNEAVRAIKYDLSQKILKNNTTLIW